MVLQQIDASTMYRHGRRIRQLQSVPDVELEDLVLCRRISAVRLDHHVHRRDSFAVGIMDSSAKLEHERRPRDAQRVGWSTESTGWWARGTQHLVQHPGRVDLALKRRAIDGMLKVSGAELVEHLDDFVSTGVSRVAHRRPPIAVANGGVLV